MGVEDTMDSGGEDIGGGDGGGSDSGIDWGTAATSAFSLGGSLLAANSSIEQAKANSEIAKYNAKIADQNADQVTQMGEENARRSLINSAKMIAAGRASYGAAGVSGGSVQDVLRAGAAQGELDALTIKYNAEVKATAFRNEANLDRYKAENQTVAGNANAAGDILKGAASFATLAAAIF
jgi:hypothetical protein